MKPNQTKTDKLCALILVAAFLAPHLAVWALDDAAYRAAEVDRPVAEIAATTPTIDFTPLVEAVESQREEIFWEDVPLDRVCQEALREACEANDVSIHLALGLIEIESGFDPAADNGNCYGLCQLNKRYWPDFLAPEDNIRCGIGYLGDLLKQYDGDTAAALRAYNRGYDDGDRVYANKVLNASEKWGCR